MSNTNTSFDIYDPAEVALALVKFFKQHNIHPLVAGPAMLYVSARSFRLLGLSSLENETAFENCAESILSAISALAEEMLPPASK